MFLATVNEKILIFDCGVIKQFMVENKQNIAVY